MTENIEKLWSDAVDFVQSSSDDDIDLTDPYVVREVRKKFAELIVRECVGIISKRKNQAIDDSWNVDEAMSMAEMDLEEHFGVEE